MEVEVVLRKYGNSTVAVLPPAVLRDLRLNAGQPMMLEAQAGKIILTPKRTHTLASMLAQCDEDAPPPADMALWDSAPPAGQEIW
jgi:antitoxin ChpS